KAIAWHAGTHGHVLSRRVQYSFRRKGTMVAGTRGKFACGSCGKSLVWKVEQAGKRVKCSCGGVTTVPPTPLGMVGAAVAGAQSLPPPPPTAQLAPAATLGYISARKRVSEAAELPIDKLIDPKRDIYVPTGIL